MSAQAFVGLRVVAVSIALLGALLFGAVVAAEESHTVRETEPIQDEVSSDPPEPYVLQFSRAQFSAKRGASMPVSSKADKREGWIRGLTADLDGAKVAAHKLDFLLQPVEKRGTLFPLRAVLLAGEDGPSPDRIRIDTRDSRIPSLSFRGLLEPTQATMNRSAWEKTWAAAVAERLAERDVEAQSGSAAGRDLRHAGERDGAEVEKAHAAEMIYFDIRLPDLDTFAGKLRNSEGRWVPIEGWASLAVLTVAMDWHDDRAGNPRLVGMSLCKKTPTTSDRPVWLRLDDPEFSWAGTADAFHFRFDANGDMQSIDPEGVFHNDIEQRAEPVKQEDAPKGLAPGGVDQAKTERSTKTTPKTSAAADK